MHVRVAPVSELSIWLSDYVELGRIQRHSARSSQESTCCARGVGVIGPVSAATTGLSDGRATRATGVVISRDSRSGVSVTSSSCCYDHGANFRVLVDRRRSGVTLDIYIGVCKSALQHRSSVSEPFGVAVRRRYRRQACHRRPPLACSLSDGRTVEIRDIVTVNVELVPCPALPLPGEAGDAAVRRPWCVSPLSALPTLGCDFAVRDTTPPSSNVGDLATITSTGVL